jgi:hypothetical protein
MGRYRVHSRTKRRLAKLEGKTCPDCGESRIKALILCPDNNISCYNCKAILKYKKYKQDMYVPHMNTKRRFVFLKNLGKKCINCGFNNIDALNIVKNRSELRCKNCLKADIIYKYEDEGIDKILRE